MTREQLSVFFQAHFCGCGSNAAAANSLMRILASFERGATLSPHDVLKTMIANDGAAYLIVYWIDKLGLIDHGSSIMCAWLEPKGQALLDALRIESKDEFAALFEGTRCIHGVSAMDRTEAHDCGTAPEVDPFA